MPSLDNPNWQYFTFFVSFRELPKNRGQRGPLSFGEYKKDWMITFDDGTSWVGWDEILSGIGENGWEIFSVVGENSNGFTSGYRIFAKRPAG